MMMTCKVCGEEYNPKNPNHAGGHLYICGLCEDKTADVQKSIGLIDAVGKTDVRISIIRNPSKGEIAMVRTQGRCGPSHCHTSLGLCSNGANTKKDKIDSVHAFLYGEEKEKSEED